MHRWIRECNFIAACRQLEPRSEPVSLYDITYDVKKRTVDKLINKSARYRRNDHSSTTFHARKRPFNRCLFIGQACSTFIEIKILDSSPENRWNERSEGKECETISSNRVPIRNPAWWRGLIKKGLTDASRIREFNEPRWRTPMFPLVIRGNSWIRILAIIFEYKR